MTIPFFKSRSLRNGDVQEGVADLSSTWLCQIGQTAEKRGTPERLSDWHSDAISRRNTCALWSVRHPLCLSAHSIYCSLESRDFWAAIFARTCGSSSCIPQKNRIRFSMVLRRIRRVGWSQFLSNVEKCRRANVVPAGWSIRRIWNVCVIK